MNNLKPTIKDIAGMLARGEISSAELTKKYLSEISRKDNELNSFITVCEESALKEAEESDKRRKRNESLGLLDGIPYSLKDNIVTYGIKTTGGSKMLESWIPPYNSTVYSKLKASGAVLLGKNNMDEFAMGSSTMTSFFEETSNPYDKSRVPGGSSGGSAAAVAAGLTPFSLGSDTGGSVRQPSSFCGTVGLKPTYGRVSRYGLIAFSSSLDQIGPITSTVEDLFPVMNVISGYDPNDSTSSKEKTDFIYNPEKSLKNITFAALDSESRKKYMEDEVSSAYGGVIEHLINSGAKVKYIDISFFNEIAVPVYYIISSAEASSNLARYDGLNYGYSYSPTDSIEELYEKTRQAGFGEEAKRRIMLGTFVLSSGYADKYYHKAQMMREKVIAKFNEIFESCDIILTPASPVKAYTKEFAAGNTIKKYADDIFTSPVNLASLPSISIPIKRFNEGMPIGLQITGKKFSENLIMNIAGGLEDEI